MSHSSEEFIHGKEFKLEIEIRLVQRGVTHCRTEYIYTILYYSLTRKLCCRKDDRAMRPIYGALKKFMTH